MATGPFVCISMMAPMRFSAGNSKKIFSSKKGGQSSVLDSLISRYLPTETAAISTDGRDDPTSTFGSVGSVKMERVRNQEGRAASIRNTPILGLVNISRTDSGHSDGTHFANSEIRAWDSWGVGSLSLFS